MPRGRTVLALLSIALFARPGVAEEAPWQDLPRLLSIRVEAPPVVDGHGREAAWADAPIAMVGASPVLHVKSVHTEDRFFLWAAWDDDQEDGADAPVRDTILVLFGQPGGGPPFDGLGLRVWTAGLAASPDLVVRRTKRGWAMELDRPLAPASATDLALDVRTEPLLGLTTGSPERGTGNGGSGTLRVTFARAGRRRAFEADAVGTLPSGFRADRTGPGPPGTWVVVAGEDRPGGQVVAQTSTDATPGRFPVLVLEGMGVGLGAPRAPSRDAFVAARFRAEAGAVDQAAGLVVRYQDPDNYYVVRANALEDNVRLYRVMGGVRELFAGVDVPVTSDAWHELALEVRGTHFRVMYEGRRLFEADDDALTRPGRAGLWTKADSVTWFDDVTCLELY